MPRRRQPGKAPWKLEERPKWAVLAGFPRKTGVKKALFWGRRVPGRVGKALLEGSRVPGGVAKVLLQGGRVPGKVGQAVVEGRPVPGRVAKAVVEGRRVPGGVGKAVLPGRFWKGRTEERGGAGNREPTEAGKANMGKPAGGKTRRGELAAIPRNQAGSNRRQESAPGNARPALAHSRSPSFSLASSSRRAAVMTSRVLLTFLSCERLPTILSTSLASIPA